jgi:putative oxidoreductase
MDQQGVLVLAAQLVLAAVYLSAAISKLREPDRFAEVVIGYAVLPAELARAYARSLPILELALGMAMLSSTLLQAVGLASAALLVTFAVGVVANLVRARKLSCGCGGMFDRRPINFATLVRLAALVGLSLFIVRHSSNVVGWDGWLRHYSEVLTQPGLAFMAVALAAAMLCLLALIEFALFPGRDLSSSRVGGRIA